MKLNLRLTALAIAATLTASSAAADDLTVASVVFQQDQFFRTGLSHA